MIYKVDNALMIGRNTYTSRKLILSKNKLAIMENKISHHFSSDEVGSGGDLVDDNGRYR